MQEHKFGGGDGFGKMQGLQDEDFKEAGSSSAPTVETQSEKSLDDELLDDP